MQSDVTFLFSSETQSPEHFFQGYFFHASDYVFGQGGFDEFRNARGIDRAIREDGCYVQAERQPDGSYLFFTDYCGYKKLFYFWDAGSWAVSNSLLRLAQHRASHGHDPVPDEAQVAAMAAEGTFYPTGRGSFFSQLTTLQTLIRGVRLMPANCILRIGPQGAVLRKVASDFTGANYVERIDRFVCTWIGRFSTILLEPSARLSCDLTGGLDSRTVFALLFAATDRGRSTHAGKPQIRSATGGGFPDHDPQIASIICDVTGFRLGGRLGKKPARLSGEESYRTWKELCLGVYHPIYFPTSRPNGEIVQFGGGGGENHRPFYDRYLREDSTDAFVARRARNLGTPSARLDFEAELRSALEFVAEHCPGEPEARVLHYRHFRNRFHFGREAQYTVTIQPLASKLLDSATALAGSRRFRVGQLFYDIIHALAPELMDVRFDKHRKKPNRVVRANLTPVLHEPTMSGRCFVGAAFSQSSQFTAPESENNASLSLLSTEFGEAAKGFAVNFLGKRYIRRAAKALDDAIETGVFSSPIASKRVAVVLACGLFDSGRIRCRKRDT